MLEWGSGASTFWLAKRAGWVESTEHDVKWYNTVDREITRNGITNVNLAHIPKDCKAYTFAPQKQPLFDLILVDGVKRDLCMKRAVGALRPGGFLVLDNAERDHIAVGIKHVPTTWRRWDFFGRARKDPIIPAQTIKETVQTQTTIWRKPDA